MVRVARFGTHLSPDRVERRHSTERPLRSYAKPRRFPRRLAPDRVTQSRSVFANSLAGAKNLAEIVELQAAYWRKQDSRRRPSCSCLPASPSPSSLACRCWSFPAELVLLLGCCQSYSSAVIMSWREFRFNLLPNSLRRESGAPTGSRRRAAPRLFSPLDSYSPRTTLPAASTK